eukprot:292609-Prorocentrum_minimum.AAC.1
MRKPPWPTISPEVVRGMPHRRSGMLRRPSSDTSTRLVEGLAASGASGGGGGGDGSGHCSTLSRGAEQSYATYSPLSPATPYGLANSVATIATGVPFRFWFEDSTCGRGARGRNV